MSVADGGTSPESDQADVLASFWKEQKETFVSSLVQRKLGPHPDTGAP